MWDVGEAPISGLADDAATKLSLGKKELVGASVEPIVSLDKERNNVEHMSIIGSLTAEAIRPIKNTIERNISMNASKNDGKIKMR